MSGGGPRLRSANISDSEGRPVLRPATGNNTDSAVGVGAGGAGGAELSKAASKPGAKRPSPAKMVKSSSDTSPNNGFIINGNNNSNSNGNTKVSVTAPKSPATLTKTMPAATYEQLRGPASRTASRSVASKAAAVGGKSPQLNASLDSAFRPSYLMMRGGSISLTASTCSSSEGSSDSSCSLTASKKAAAHERYAQKRLRIAGYGRAKTQSRPVKVVPDGVSVPPPPSEEALKRCGWITPQSDPLYVAFHDEEWGVPVHDDKKLFEFLILSSALQELSWPAILSKRETYREIFCGFDPVSVANFDERKIRSLKSNSNVMLYEGKLRGLVDNAKYFLKIVAEFGSFDNYCWSFVGYKPLCNKYRYPRQVPVKIPKAEVISKDLVRRGFRYVGPTIMYSFMQAVGMTNDHLLSCFRHEPCNQLVDEQQSTDSNEDCIREEARGRELERIVTVLEGAVLSLDCQDI